MSYWAIIKKRLEALKISQDQIVLRGFDSSRLTQLEETGTDREDGTIFASTTQDIEDKTSLSESAVWSAFQLPYEHPAISVYRAGMLREVGFYEYKPIEGKTLHDALLIVFRFKF